MEDRRGLIPRTFRVDPGVWEILKARELPIAELVRDFLEVLAGAPDEETREAAKLRVAVKGYNESIKKLESEEALLQERLKQILDAKELRGVERDIAVEKFNRQSDTDRLHETYAQINSLIKDNIGNMTAEGIWDMVDGYGLLKELERLGELVTFESFESHIEKLKDGGYA